MACHVGFFRGAPFMDLGFDNARCLSLRVHIPSPQTALRGGRFAAGEKHMAHILKQGIGQGIRRGS